MVLLFFFQEQICLNYKNIIKLYFSCQRIKSKVHQKGKLLQNATNKLYRVSFLLDTSFINHLQAT